MSQNLSQQAQALIGQGRYDEARALVSASSDPNAPQLLAMLDQMIETNQVQTLIRQGQFAEARAILNASSNPMAAQLLESLDQIEQQASSSSPDAATSAGTGDFLDLDDNLANDLPDAPAAPTAPGNIPAPVDDQEYVGAADPGSAANTAAGLAQSVLGEIRRNTRDPGAAAALDALGGVLGQFAGASGPRGGSRTIEGGTYEMLWDCQFCGTTKLLGLTHRYCPNCGAAQNPDSRYFPSDEEKVAVENHVYHGVDVTCPACDTLNNAKAEFCFNCGSPLTEGAKAKRLAEESRAEGQGFASGGSRDVKMEAFEAEMSRIGVSTGTASASSRARQSASPANRIRNIGIVVIILALIGGAIFAFTRTEESTVSVTGHEWSRTIAIESMQRVPDGAWCDQMPGDAYNVSRSERQRSTRRVPDGEDCRTVRRDNGDGTFSERQECTTRYREEPVYDTYCNFTVDRWRFARNLEASGSSLNETPRWPEVGNLRRGSCIGCEREGSRNETYAVFFRDNENDRDFTCNFDNEATWRSYGLESLWALDITSLTGQPQCNTLRAPGT